MLLYQVPVVNIYHNTKSSHSFGSNNGPRSFSSHGLNLAILLLHVRPLSCIEWIKHNLCIDTVEMFVYRIFKFLYWVGVMDVILMCAIDGSNSFMTPAYFHSRTVFLYSTFKKKGGGGLINGNSNLWVAKGWKNNIPLKIPCNRTNLTRTTCCVKYFNKALLKIPS